MKFCVSGKKEMVEGGVEIIKKEYGSCSSVLNIDWIISSQESSGGGQLFEQ